MIKDFEKCLSKSQSRQPRNRTMTWEEFSNRTPLVESIRKSVLTSLKKKGRR